MKCKSILLSISAVLLFGLIFFSRISNAADVLACPDSILVQESIKEIPEGWTPFVEEGPHRLMKMSFFDGNPQEKGELAPEKERKKKGKLYSTWRFDPDTAQNLWISCSYGRTSMTLVRPLKKKFESCTVTSDSSVSIGGLPAILSTECK